MKLLVILASAICIAGIQAASSSGSKPKMEYSGNSVQHPQKLQTTFAHPELYQQIQPTLVPIQIIPRSVYVSQQQPHAMLIIAQPTYTPQNQGYYVNPLQELLSYFHSNPQARLQLLYGSRQQPQTSPQDYFTHHQTAAPTILYQVAPHPVSNSYSHHPTYPEAPYVQQYGHLPLPVRSTPPLITGFENFTPEQQAQIKSQLGLHLGPPITTTATIPSNTVATQPTQVLNSEEYVKEGKSLQASGTAYAPQLVYRSQFTKG